MQERLKQNLIQRKRIGKVVAVLCGFSAFVGVVLLLVLLIKIGRDGYEHLDWQFISSFPSRFPEKAGIKSALVGSLWVMVGTAFFSLPIGIGAGIYLTEYSKKNWFQKFIQLNISNLAGVPSIVYGILGLAVFVRWMDYDRSLLSGALTMTLLVLPTIIVVSQEALKAIPNSIRLAAFSLGASRWQTIRDHVLPAALPGIMTGVIFAMSRALGETAPLIMIGALSYIAFVPTSPTDSFTALPIQVFNWASRPQNAFHEIAATGIIVLLAMLLLMNATAIYLRYRFQRSLSS